MLAAVSTLPRAGLVQVAPSLSRRARAPPPSVSPQKFGFCCQLEPPPVVAKGFPTLPFPRTSPPGRARAPACDDDGSSSGVRSLRRIIFGTSPPPLPPPVIIPPYSRAMVSVRVSGPALPSLLFSLGPSCVLCVVL